MDIDNRKGLPLLVKLTSSYSGKPIAIDHGIIGEVRDLSYDHARKIGKTEITNKSTRRCKWLVEEEYKEVMAQVRVAELYAGGQLPGCLKI